MPRSSNGSGRPLPAKLRREMEAELGLSLARVRMHIDPVAAQAARAARAEAFTVGEDIFFADKAYAPETEAGRKLLVHELAHVAQALRGRTASAREGMRVSQPSDALEREAESLAEQVERNLGRRAPTRSSAFDPLGARAFEAQPGRQTSRLSGSVHRHASGAAPAATIHRAELEALVEGSHGDPLPDELRERLARRLDGMGEVRVHTGSTADTAARFFQADAFAIGRDIYFAHGRYDPMSVAGQRLIAHEAAHTTQHRHAPAGAELAVSSPDDAHEQQADAFADDFIAAGPGPQKGALTRRADPDPPRRVQLRSGEYQVARPHRRARPQGWMTCNQISKKLFHASSHRMGGVGMWSAASACSAGAPRSNRRSPRRGCRSGSVRGERRRT